MISTIHSRSSFAALLKAQQSSQDLTEVQAAVSTCVELRFSHGDTGLNLARITFLSHKCPEYNKKKTLTAGRSSETVFPGETVALCS